MINLYYDILTEYGPVTNGVSDYVIPKIGDRVPHAIDTSHTNVVCPVTMFYNTMIAAGVKPNLYSNGNVVEDLYYPIEMQCPNNYESFIVPDQTLELLRERKLKALILFQEEGTDGWVFEGVVKFARKLSSLGIDEKNIVIVVGDLHRTYTEYFKPFKVYGFDWWQIKHQITCKSRYSGTSYLWTSTRRYDKPLDAEGLKREAFDIDQWGRPGKLFLSYNGNRRIHRIGLVGEIVALELDKKGYLSWGVHPGPFTYDCEDERIIDYSQRPILFRNKIKAVKFLQENTLVIDHDGHDFFDQDDRKYNSKHYYDSAFSVVTETFAPAENNSYPNDEFNVLWTTEKTWKPIAIGHPFLLLGSVHTLQYLRSEGYYTFPELFDESYDNERDLIKRTKMIVNNIERLANMDPSMLHGILEDLKPKLKFNRELFYRKQHAKKFEVLFQQIIDENI